MSNEKPTQTHEKRDFGVIAAYDDVTTLKKACEEVRDAGYKHWDAHSPFPVHGIDPAIGIKPTKLPMLIFAMGLTGLASGVFMQWWMNAHDYAFMISGKPFWSLPANIPVAFEVTVLFAAVTAVFATLIANGLPRFHTPLFTSERFQRSTDDRFFIAIEAKDSKYDREKTQALLESTGGTDIEVIIDDSMINAKPPSFLIYLGLIAFVAGFVPLALTARAWFSKSEQPRIHLNPNMDFQKKFKAQTANPMFADNRSMRPHREDTVAVANGRADEHYYEGLIGDAWATKLPQQIEVSEKTMTRGEERFNVYCQPCHGMAGYGDGLVARRAELLGLSTWVPPTSMHQDNVLSQPDGKLFNTITHGIRNMPAYGHLIPEADRWSIVLYVRALQRSQRARLSDVPVGERAKLQ